MKNKLGNMVRIDHQNLMVVLSLTLLQGFALGTCEGWEGGSEYACIGGDAFISITPPLEAVTDTRDFLMYCPTSAFNTLTGQTTPFTDGVMCFTASSGGTATLGKYVLAGTVVGGVVGEIADSMSQGMESVVKLVRKVLKKNSDSMLKLLDDLKLFKHTECLNFLKVEADLAHPLESIERITEATNRLMRVIGDYRFEWNKLIEYFNPKETTTLSTVIKDLDDFEDVAKGTKKALNEVEDISDVAGGAVDEAGKIVQAECLKNLGRIPRRDFRAISYDSEDVAEWSAGVIGKKGVDKKLETIAESSNTGNLKGAIFEVETAYKKSDQEIEELSKDITTQFGSTDIDILHANGDIRECKNFDWSKNPPGSLPYNALKDNLEYKINIFNEYKEPSAKVIVSFKSSVDEGIYNWLKNVKGVDVEVIT